MPRTQATNSRQEDNTDNEVRVAQLERQLADALERIERLERRLSGSETPEARERRLDASKRGSAKVSERFQAVRTRRRFAQEVGVSEPTVIRWVKAGILKPELRTDVSGNVPTNVFSEADVEFANALREIQSQRPGKYTIEEAAALARKALKARR